MRSRTQDTCNSRAANAKPERRLGLGSLNHNPKPSHPQPNPPNPTPQKNTTPPQPPPNTELPQPLNTKPETLNPPTPHPHPRKNIPSRASRTGADWYRPWTCQGWAWLGAQEQTGEFRGGPPPQKSPEDPTRKPWEPYQNHNVSCFLGIIVPNKNPHKYPGSTRLNYSGVVLTSYVRSFES